jgi:hypothetical protein
MIKGIKIFLSLANLEVYKKIFVSGGTTFKPFKKGVIFWMEKKTT